MPFTFILIYLGWKTDAIFFFFFFFHLNWYIVIMRIPNGRTKKILVKKGNVMWKEGTMEDLQIHSLHVYHIGSES